MERYAVIQTGGKQYRVAVGDLVRVERCGSPKGVNKVEFPVLMIEEGEKVEIGKPLLTSARVSAEILGEERGKKIIIYKYKKRKGYDKKQGHRQNLTVVKITEIKAGT